MLLKCFEKFKQNVKYSSYNRNYFSKSEKSEIFRKSDNYSIKLIIN